MYARHLNRIRVFFFVLILAKEVVGQKSPVADISPSLTSIPVATIYPTDSPFISPTRIPTRKSESLQPESPGSQGTTRPTSRRTGEPITPKPTDYPTWSPSPEPSMVPSNSPVTEAPVTPPVTLSPTTRPSRKQSSSPSIYPSVYTALPTKRPTSVPTIGKTRTPSSNPTVQLSDSLVTVVMILENTIALGSSSEITFQRITGDHIYNGLLNLDDVTWLNLTVGTNVKIQREMPASNGGGRQLQTSSLEITFDTAVSFRSKYKSLDIASLVGRTFQTEDDLTRYLQRLQASGDKAFSSVTKVKVPVIGDENQEVERPASNGGEHLKFIIIGAVVGALLITLMAIFLYARKRGRNKSVSVSVIKKRSVRKLEERLGADILMDKQDDISTLGDPMYVPGGMIINTALERDETVTPSIVSGDWDYARNYGRSSGPNLRTRSDTLQSSMNGSMEELSSFGTLAKMDNSIYSDDMSFEQQFVDIEDRFEIDAPAGKLGMVIDTPSGGVPFVHAIKSSSVLADRVQIGDRLISVDDEDTTGLTAMQVSKMISGKAENRSRILVFLRTRARANSGDGMPQ